MRVEPALGQDRGVNTAREVAELVDRTGQLGGGAIELGGELGEIGRHRCPRRAHLQRDRDEPLLGAVMQVAPETAPGLVGGNNDAFP